MIEPPAVLLTSKYEFVTGSINTAYYLTVSICLNLCTCYFRATETLSVCCKGVMAVCYTRLGYVMVFCTITRTSPGIRSVLTSQ